MLHQGTGVHRTAIPSLPWLPSPMRHGPSQNSLEMFPKPWAYSSQSLQKSVRPSMRRWNTWKAGGAKRQPLAQRHHTQCYTGSRALKGTHQPAASIGLHITKHIQRPLAVAVKEDGGGL